MGSIGFTGGMNVTAVRTSTEGKEFPLGSKTEIVNSEGRPVTYVYIEAGAALSAGKVYAIDGDYKATNGVASTHLGYNCVIPQVAIASGGFGWAAVDGPVDYINTLSGTSALQALYTSATAGTLDDASSSQARMEGLVLLDSQATSAGNSSGVIVGPLRVAGATS